MVMKYEFNKNMKASIKASTNKSYSTYYIVFYALINLNFLLFICQNFDTFLNIDAILSNSQSNNEDDQNEKNQSEMNSSEFQFLEKQFESEKSQSKFDSQNILLPMTNLFKFGYYPAFLNRKINMTITINHIRMH